MTVHLGLLTHNECYNQWARARRMAMGQRQTVKIIHGALDELPSGSIILRGVISPDSFNLLRVAPYQREVSPDATIADLMKGYKEGRIPDIEMGMRGENCDWLIRNLAGVNSI